MAVTESHKNTKNTKKQETQICKFDFTLKHNKSFDENDIIKDLHSFCKSFVFQLEESSTGYVHWQGRVSLIKKKRLSELCTQCKSFSSLSSIHWSPTSNAGTGKLNYVMKDDTRVKGPFKDTDEPIVITQQMKMFSTWSLRPWQQSLINTTSQFCLRSIDLVYDPQGNAGKSLFSEYMESEGTSEEVPPFRLMDDIFQWVCSRPIKKVYIVDMPRGMKKDKLGDFYSGIEVIKNGVAYDKRYTAKKIRFDRPRIIVFSNELPNLDLMSADRWKLWTIKDHCLETFNPNDKFDLPDDSDSE